MIVENEPLVLSAEHTTIDGYSIPTETAVILKVAFNTLYLLYTAAN